MFVTNDEELFRKVQTLNNHGRRADQAKQFWADEIGFKYKMTNVAAAIGCAQLERIDELVSRKRWVFDAYQSKLATAPLAMNPEPHGCVNGYWMPTVVVDKGVAFNREAVLADFAANDIDGRVFFWPLSNLPMFAQRPKNAVAQSLFARALNLPSYHEIDETGIDRVCAILRAHL